MSGKPPFVFRWRRALLDSGVGPSAKNVGLVLSTHMDATGGSCFPGQRQIARESGLARNTVAKAIDELEEAKLIDVERGHQRVPTQYAARLPVAGVMAQSEPTYGSTGQRVMAQSEPSYGSVGEPEGVHLEGEGPEGVHLEGERQEQHLEIGDAPSAHPPPPNGWPPGLGKRKIEDLQALCRLVESLNDRTPNTLKAFVLDELPRHGGRDFNHALDRLLHARKHGIGDAGEPVRDEAAYARHVLRRIEDHWEWP